MAEIAWLDQLRQASWRGVPFQVDTIEITAGQNTVLREYPFQDLPTVFSMGAAAEDIKFNGYVIGDDYLDQLAALREVLSGDGILIHPTQGSIRCYYHGKYSIKEAPSAEGGIARIDLTFVRAEERRYPVASANSSDKLASTSAAAKTSMLDTFAKKFGITGVPGWSLDNMRTSMRDALDTSWSVISQVQSEMTAGSNFVRDYITNPTNEIFAIKDIIGSTVGDIMRIPDNIASNQALSMFSSLRSLWSSAPSPAVASAPQSSAGVPASQTTSVASIYQGTGVAITPGVGQALQAALTPSKSPYKTPARQREAENYASLSNLFEGVATVAAAQAVAQIELQNYDQALALRQDFNQQFTKLLQLDLADHDTLLALHIAVLTDLQDRSKDLARTTTYTPETWQPAIYISYRLFGTAIWADEIVAMNPHIRNPLLVPPGRPLRIVKRD